MRGPGWKLLDAGGQRVKSAEDLRSVKLRIGQAWVKLTAYDSQEVQVTCEEASVARFLSACAASNFMIHPHAVDGPELPCAANAVASENEAWASPARLRVLLQLKATVQSFASLAGKTW